VWWFVNGSTGGPRARIGEPAPPIVGTTLDGDPLDLATYRGRPVIVNFWGPSCIPCREEFPQFLQKLDQHAADDLAIIGILTDDPAEPARRFATEYGATWPTIVDPEEALKRT
jgi:cytochrome c biogenesis protein CcmG/thiol:disulfide interchange protein DsbE